MQQDIVNSDLPCVGPSSHILFTSQYYQATPVSLCFAEMTLSSNPVIQVSEEEWQILSCLQNIDSLSRTEDRIYLLRFDTKLLKATQIFFAGRFHIHPWKSYQDQVSFACLEKCHVFTLKFATVKSYQIYCFLVHKTYCSTIKAKQIELSSNFWKQFAYTQYIKNLIIWGKEHLGSCIQSF